MKKISLQQRYVRRLCDLPDAELCDWHRSLDVRRRRHRQMRQEQPIRRMIDPTTAPTIIAHTGGCFGPDEDSGDAVGKTDGEAELSFLTCVGSLADVIE